MSMPNIQHSEITESLDNMSLRGGATEKHAADSLLLLLSRCRRGDRSAFVSLYKATSAKLYAIALRILHSEHWAEDALQESFLKIWKHADKYNNSKGRPMTWMINIVRNQALDMLRNPQYRAEFEKREPELEPSLDDRDPETQAEVSDGVGKLISCMQQLHDGQRRIILLIYHQGYTPTEIARREGCPIGTVKTWLRRGLAEIKHQMQLSNPAFGQ